MKMIYLAGMLALLSACTPTGREDTSYTVMPQGLRDCKVYTITNDSGGRLYVVRCPNSDTSTTYKSGKVNKTVVSSDK